MLDIQRALNQARLLRALSGLNRKAFDELLQSDIILLNVRWYCRYALSYRDLEEMMRARGVEVDQTTTYRWVQDYASELDKRIRPCLNPTN